MVAEVAELLQSSRLVTLTGVGGVGKTRLALEFGAEVAGEFPDGVWMVELASVGDPASVPAAIANVLGITPQGDTALIDTVADALEGRELLLVVDNCEHVLAAAGSAMAAILGRSDRVRILATSRETLGVDGETALAVVPLALDGGATSDAVTLFVDRARAVRPDFGLRETETATAVTEICAALDGLPLGIELAASRMAAMSAVEVRDRLADRFRLLKGSTPGPERQLTLRHTVEWSYDLLSDDERDLLRLTSVFAGGFDLTSLCAVGDAADDVEVLRHLDSLVRKSLVVADHRATRTRYRLFETIRQFAEDRLAETGALERARDRHAEYFAGESGRRWEYWNGPGWRDSVDWVEAELDNLRAGYQWSAARGDLEVATDIAAHAGLMGFSVQLFETLGWAEDLLEPRGGSRRPPSPPPVHGRRFRVLRREARGRASERAPGDRAGGRRPLRRRASRDTRRSSRPWPACTAVTSIATSSSPGRWCISTEATAATAWPPTSTASSPVAGSTRRSRSPRTRSPRRGRSATPTGSRTRSGSPAWRSRGRTYVAHSPPGKRASPWCASTAFSSSRASSHATRLACTRPKASPRRRSCSSRRRSRRSSGPAMCPS